jgi:hypothetical protein
MSTLQGTEEQAGASASSLSDDFDRVEKSSGANQDTKDPRAVANFSVDSGSDAVAGEDGREVRTFAVTVHELKQLADYWAQEEIEYRFDLFLGPAIFKEDGRWCEYVENRLDRLSETLGPAAIESAYRVAIASFRGRHPHITDEDWQVFIEGGDEEVWRETSPSTQQARRSRAMAESKDALPLERPNRSDATDLKI